MFCRLKPRLVWLRCWHSAAPGHAPGAASCPAGMPARIKAQSGRLRPARSRHIPREDAAQPRARHHGGHAAPAAFCIGPGDSHRDRPPAPEQAKEQENTSVRPTFSSLTSSGRKIYPWSKWQSGEPRSLLRVPSLQRRRAAGDGQQLSTLLGHTKTSQFSPPRRCGNTATRCKHAFNIYILHRYSWFNSNLARHPDLQPSSGPYSNRRNPHLALLRRRCGS